MTRNGQAADLARLLDKFSLSPDFPPEVLAEAQQWERDPGFDDPALDDLRSLPFVTIDNADSKDLDQALCIDTSDAAGPVVHYALADGSFYVRRGSALYAEALRRGASFYLPKFVVPMLPKVLSEGIVSLNPQVPRRAMVFSIRLDAEGRIVDTTLRRSLIRSRAKLTYDGVQAFMDAPRGHAFEGAEFEASLWGLKSVGLARIRRAEARGVVQYNRVGVVVTMGEGGWEAHPDVRNDVEKYNEQISLLCNSEGARFVADGADAEPHVQPVFKVHPEPERRQLEALEREITEIVRAHGLPGEFLWRPERETLADYIRGLPSEPRFRRVRQAIERQAMIMGSPSRFSQERGCHYGVGADAYGRFTAPMREMVGIFTHQEAFEKLAGHGRADDELAQKVIEAGNRSKKLQRQITKAVYKVVLDRVFGEEARRDDPVVRPGTVLGAHRGRLYVMLDDPPLDVKIYARDVPTGARFRPGDAIRIAARPDRRGWRLVPVV